MVNSFPELLSLGMLAPLIIRLTVGVFFIILGYHKFTHQKQSLIAFTESINIKPADLFIKTLGFVELVIGATLIIGLFTQVAAMVGAIIALVSFIVAVREPDLKLRTNTEYAFLFIMAFSLMLTGAGLISIDLPL